MAKFKNLKNFLAALTHEEVTLSNIVCKRIHHKTKGWVNLDSIVTPELKESILIKLIACLGGSKGDIIKRNIEYGYIKDAGILERVIMRLSARDKVIRTSYCAGQDYSSEIRYIRNYLTK